MASRLILTSETPEERELRKRRGTLKRLRLLAATLGLVVLARIFIKNPPPPKPPDYRKDAVRFIPGMLDAIPAAERSKIDPKLLARMQQADDDARRGYHQQPPSLLAATPYKAMETPLTNQAAVESDLQFQYAYAKKRAVKVRELEAQEMRDTTKTTVVQFARGGYLRVEQAERGARACEIKFDHNMVAHVPSTLVTNVLPNAAQWVPPIPKGQISLKPSRGITIILDKQIASRVTITPGMFQ